MNAKVSDVGWLWAGASGVATMIGAAAALRLFPGAAFAANPTGQLGWNLVGVALGVGIPFALAQWLLLQLRIGIQGPLRALLLVCWIPASASGIAVMILPLYWWHATVLMFNPWMVVVPTLPGILLLGVMQWLILYALLRVRFKWATLTITGALVGVLLGLLASVFTPLPLEPTWALVTGFSIGAFQSSALQELTAA